MGPTGMALSLLQFVALWLLEGPWLLYRSDLSQPPWIFGLGIRIVDTTSTDPAGVTGILGVVDTAQSPRFVFRHQFIQLDSVVGIVYPARLISHATRRLRAIAGTLTDRLVLSQVVVNMLR